jgi:acylaminoacyl-peptidase
MKPYLRLLAAGVLALGVSIGAIGAAEARPFTARDMVTLDRLSDPRISPDGKYVIYSRRVVDYDANRATTELWVVDLSVAGSAPRRVDTGAGNVSSARWGNDSKTIWFMSSRGGSNQVWKADVAAGAPAQVTSLPLDVGAFRLSPDGTKMVVGLSVFPDCPTLDCTKQRQDARSGSRQTGVVFSQLFIRHWDEWSDGTRNHLFTLSIGADGKATGPVAIMHRFDGDVPTKPFGDETDYSFSADGRTILFSARQAGRTEPWSTNFDVWRVNVDGSGQAALNETVSNAAWDAQPVPSPDGRMIAYRAMKRAGFEADRFGIMIREGTTTRELAPAWDRSADTIIWSKDSRTIYTFAGDTGQTRIFAIDVRSGRVTAVTGPGNVGGFDVGPNGIAYTQDNLASPAQVFYLPFTRNAQPRQLTQANADKLAGVEFGQYEQFEFPGWNGETVHGYLVKPAGFDATKRYPVAFLIHGGPQGSFGNLFHYRWNAQTYAGQGYAVVMIDFHGSTGYGQAFTDAISQHWGDRPLEDLKKGWAFALSRYPFLDAGRACALGGSYGGFMVNWIAGNWNEPWKCLVNHDGIFDARFMGYSTEELWFSEWENGGTPYQPNTTYEAFNPAVHVQNWRVPMLVVHGGRDYRVPLEQGISTFTALQRKGVESKFLYFADENHWVLKPQNSVQWHDEVNGWLRRWAPPN